VIMGGARRADTAAIQSASPLGDGAPFWLTLVLSKEQDSATRIFGGASCDRG
jgi:hypothetical protein